MAKAKPEEEYKIVSDNIRWYSNIRFAQLTLFFALTAGLYNSIIPPNPTLPNLLSIILKVGGILSTFAFAYLEWRADAYWLHFMNRACSLEKKLGFRQYTDRPSRAFPTSTIIMMMYAAVAIFWVFTIVCLT
jgi:hypothetical protein